jgi:hypothetical protein
LVQADFAAALEHRDTMMFAIPIAPTSSAISTNPRQREYRELSNEVQPIDCA